MLEQFDLNAVIHMLLDWSKQHLWTESTAVQLILIALSVMTASVAYRYILLHTDEHIDKLKIRLRVKNNLKNFRRLSLPLITLCLIFISTRIAATDTFGINVGLSSIVMKLLLAWIAIRAALQFITNPIARNIFAFSIWAIAALSIFGILEETTAILNTIGMSIGGFRISLLAVIKGIFSLFALLYIALFVSGIIERRIYTSKGLRRSSQVLIAKIVRVFLIVCALIIGITSAGIDLSLFAVFGGAIGLGIGFGLQRGVSNLFSGMLLLLDRSIEPGDVIELEGGTFGWVDHMGARYTEIVTRDNKSFLIPNEDFITQRVVNWSHGSSLIRLETRFGVSYKHNPHQISEIAIEAAKMADDRVCKDPEPVCHLTDFGESSLNFTLRFWIKDAEKGVTNIKGSVMLALWDAFQKYNITIPYPHREVYLHEAAPALPPTAKKPAKKNEN